MTVFVDSVNGFDLTVGTPADWTVSAGVLPNGDNASALVTSLTHNADWVGEDFCLPDGAGTDARTLECWVNVTVTGTNRTIATVRDDGTDPDSPHRQWFAGISTAEHAVFFWQDPTPSSPSGTTYLQITNADSDALTAGWHHIVYVIQCGTTRSVSLYVDATLAAFSDSTSGDPVTAADGTYRLYVGASRTVADWEMSNQMAKVAWYERALTSGEITNHYLAMVS